MTIYPHRRPPHAPNAFHNSFGLWTGDFTDWGGLFVLNSRTSASRAHPVLFWSHPQNRFLFQGSPLALLSARMTGGARPFQRCPKRKGDWSLSLNIPIGHVWRSDLTQIRRWTQTQAPSAPRAAIRYFLSGFLAFPLDF